MELRKRKAQTDTAPPPVKKASSVKSSSSNQKYNSAVTPEIVAAGNSIDLDSFGGEVETHDGSKVTLKQLIDQSNAGVVLFTYPKASTPGCR